MVLKKVGHGDKSLLQKRIPTLDKWLGTIRGSEIIPCKSG